MRNSTNPELRGAWATVPEVAEAQERYEAAVKLRRDFPRGMNPGEALAGVQRAAIDAFQGSGKWSSSFAKDAAKAHADAVVWEAEAVALNILEQRAKETAESTRDLFAVDVLEYLHGRLTKVLADAKSASETLGDVTTAEEALEAGADVQGAWRRLKALLQDYGNIKSAQWDVLGAVAGMDRRAQLGQWQRAGFGELRDMRADDIPEHVRDVMRSGAYTLEYLAFVAKSGAGYVPTSYEDVQTEAEPLVDVMAGADDVVDISPTVLPPLTYQPSTNPEHATAPQLSFMGAQ
ncbi:hypothetical protein [Streptomyces sp. SGAir0957]